MINGILDVYGKSFKYFTSYKVAKPQLGVWNAYNSHSGEGLAGQFSRFGNYVIMQFEKWKMGYDFFIPR